MRQYNPGALVRKRSSRCCCCCNIWLSMLGLRTSPLRKSSSFPTKAAQRFHVNQRIAPTKGSAMALTATALNGDEIILPKIGSIEFKDEWQYTYWREGCSVVWRILWSDKEEKYLLDQLCSFVNMINEANRLILYRYQDFYNTHDSKQWTATIRKWPAGHCASRHGRRDTKKVHHRVSPCRRTLHRGNHNWRFPQPHRTRVSYTYATSRQQMGQSPQVGRVLWSPSLSIWMSCVSVCPRQQTCVKTCLGSISCPPWGVFVPHDSV